MAMRFQQVQPRVRVYQAFGCSRQVTTLLMSVAVLTPPYDSGF